MSDTCFEKYLLPAEKYLLPAEKYLLPAEKYLCKNCVKMGYTDGKARCGNHKCYCGSEYEYSTGIHGHFVWKECTSALACQQAQLGFTNLTAGDYVPPGQLAMLD